MSVALWTVIGRLDTNVMGNFSGTGNDPGLDLQCSKNAWRWNDLVVALSCNRILRNVATAFRHGECLLINSYFSQIPNWTVACSGVI